MPQYQHFIPQFSLSKYNAYQEPKPEQFTGPDHRRALQKAITKANNRAKVNIINLDQGTEDMKFKKQKICEICGDMEQQEALRIGPERLGMNRDLLTELMLAKACAL